jgi:predicted TPR repeat methyltransferase
MMFRKMATLPTATTETTATLTEKACGSPQPLDELRILYRKRCVRHLASSHRRFHPDNPAIMLAAFWLSAVWGDGPKGDGGLDNNRDGPDDENDSSVIAPASPVLRCPPAYVVGLYSTFASRFDALLVDKLRYQTPQLLRDLVDQVLSGGGKSRTFLTGLDLGCGTGLSGLAFRGRVLDWLRGVDLSPEMLDHARNRRLCYDELLVGDVTSSASYGMDNNGDPATALPSSSSQCTPATWDLIYACDVLVYLGDLEPVFALVAAHLTPVSGVFAFSTELLRESDDGDQGASPAASITDNPSSKTRDYRLLPTGRFAHSIPYLRGLAARLGLKVLATKVSPLRKDRGRDVLGCLAVLEKKASRRLPPT